MTNPADGSLESQSREDSVSLAWLVARVKRLEREFRASEAIDGLQADLGEADSMETVGEFALDFLETMLGIDRGRLSLIDGEFIEPTRADNSSDELEAVDHSLASRAVRTGRAQQFPDPRAGFKTESSRSGNHPFVQLAVPIKMRGEVVGVIHLSRARGKPFTEDDMRIVETVSEHVAVALDRLAKSKFGLSQSLRLDEYR
jgi:GAF domain-containing protein